MRVHKAPATRTRHAHALHGAPATCTDRRAPVTCTSVARAHCDSARWRQGRLVPMQGDELVEGDLISHWMWVCVC